MPHIRLVIAKSCNVSRRFSFAPCRSVKEASRSWVRQGAPGFPVLVCSFWRSGASWCCSSRSVSSSTNISGLTAFWLGGRRWGRGRRSGMGKRRTRTAWGDRRVKEEYSSVVWINGRGGGTMSTCYFMGRKKVSELIHTATHRNTINLGRRLSSFWKCLRRSRGSIYSYNWSFDSGTNTVKHYRVFFSSCSCRCVCFFGSRVSCWRQCPGLYVIKTTNAKMISSEMSLNDLGFHKADTLSRNTPLIQSLSIHNWKLIIFISKPLGKKR